MREKEWKDSSQLFIVISKGWNRIQRRLEDARSMRMRDPEWRVNTRCCRLLGRWDTACVYLKS